MQKAVVGTFFDQQGVDRAISKLRERGFPGDLIALVVRDPLAGNMPSVWPRVPSMNPAKGGLVGLVSGAVVGLLMGFAFSPVTTTAQVATSTVANQLAPFGLLGAIVGLVVGLLMGGIAAASAQHTQRVLWRTVSARQDFLLGVPTDEGHIGDAREAMTGAGAAETRRGGLSAIGEFALHAAPVQPEVYGGRPAVTVADTSQTTAEAAGPAVPVAKEGQPGYLAKETVAKEHPKAPW